MRRQQEEHRHINFVEHVKQGCFCSLLGFWILSSIRLSNARVWLRSLSLSLCELVTRFPPGVTFDFLSSALAL